MLQLPGCTPLNMLACSLCAPVPLYLAQLPSTCKTQVVALAEYLEWAGEELAGLVGAGAVPVGLGPHRLRVETASMSVLAASILFADSEP